MKLCLNVIHDAIDLKALSAKMPPGLGEPLLVGRTVQIISLSDDPQTLLRAMPEISRLAASDPAFLPTVWIDN